MARTAINISEIMNSSSKGNSAKNTVGNVEYGIGATRSRIDSKILNRNGIGGRINSVKNKVGSIEDDIAKICAAVNDAAIKYQNAENTVSGYAKVVMNGSNLQNQSASTTGQYSALFHELEGNLSFEDIASALLESDRFPVVEPEGEQDKDWTDIFKDICIQKPYLIPSLLSLVSPITSLLYITSGIPFGNTPSFFDNSRTPSSGASADWLGYEFSEDNPGVTAWVGKASAEAQSEWGYAGVNAYLGKAEAEAKADFGFMKADTGKEYKDGKWEDKDSMEFITAEVGASASVSVLEGDAEAGLGSDMLGIEGKAEGSVGTAKAEVKGEFSVGEKGVDANVGGEAMVAAVEGEASGTINILGLEITGKVGGYAGAVGVEGKVGIDNNKFVLEGGVAALIGGSVGVEIGFNDEGWDNFVDFIVFWD